ncbi:MAG TPA: TIR domain-containing protein [Polyangiales bacterium]|nr:TIR domain-containing protein [Polyangiales bacterium]
MSATQPSSSAALDILLVVPAARDQPSAALQACFESLQAELRHLGERVTLLPGLHDATESALRQRLQEGPHVLHFVGHGRIHRASNYATMTLTAADGRGRAVNLRNLASVLSTQPATRLLVLQSCEAERFPFAGAAEMLVACGVNAVIELGALSAREQPLAVTALYGAIADGRTLREALEHANQRLALSGARVQLTLFAADPDERLLSLTGTRNAAPVSAPTSAPETAPNALDVMRERLVAKRSAGCFDVFLCHNGADKHTVKQIGRALKAKGILPWLDEWELPPGQPWQALLERQIGTIRSAAVFVGRAGMGPWQEREVDALLRAFVNRQAPIIPVLLSDAPTVPVLPTFLGAMTWVDFRLADPDPLARLSWGITGERPEES